MWPHNLGAPTNVDAPEPVGVCDRCYFLYPLRMLVYQYEYRGNSLHNTGLRVCPRDLDQPADQLRPVIIRGPEGVVKNPRPPNYAANSAGGVAAPESVADIIPDDAP